MKKIIIGLSLVFIFVNVNSQSYIHLAKDYINKQFGDSVHLMYSETNTSDGLLKIISYTKYNSDKKATDMWSYFINKDNICVIYKYTTFIQLYSDYVKLLNKTRRFKEYNTWESTNGSIWFLDTDGKSGTMTLSNYFEGDFNKE